MNRSGWVAVLAVALWLTASAHAQHRRDEVLDLALSWRASAPPTMAKAVLEFAAQCQRARAGERAKVRAEVEASYVARPALFREMIQAKRRFAPEGTLEQRAAALRYSLGVSMGGLVDLLGISPDQLVLRLRRSAPGWAGRTARFDAWLKARDYDAADREFTFVSRAVLDVYEQELPPPRALTAPASVEASAAPRVATSPVAVEASPVSTAPSAEQEGQAQTPRRKRWPLVLGVLVVAALAGGGAVYARQRKPAVLDLTAPLGLLARGKPDGALAALQTLLPRAGAAVPEVRAHMVRCMVRMGQIELAMQALADLDRDRVPPRALYLLARDLEDRAQTKTALELYAKVYLVAADLEDTRERYERLRATSGLSAAILSPADLAARLPARYTKAELIGHGGMGIVMKAFDTQGQRAVALKVIAPAVASDTSFVSRFRREIRALTALDHPSIIKVLDSAVAPFPFYAMELLTGQTLTQVMKPGALPVGRAVRLVMQAAQGLASAHSAGVVHRDVKPDNIMVEAQDRVKLLDFGLAHLAGATSLTQTGVTAGSQPYMAPEQMRGEATGGPADVYALGLVLYQALAGRPAFGTAQPTMRLVQEPPPLTTVPPPLATLVARCTALHPDDRPTMSQLAAALENFAHEETRA